MISKAEIVVTSPKSSYSALAASIGGATTQRVGGSFFFFFSHLYFSASRQAVVAGVVPSPPRFLPSIFVAHRVQKSHCLSIFRRALPTYALALSTSQFVRKKKSLSNLFEYAIGGTRTHESDL